MILFWYNDFGAGLFSAMIQVLVRSVNMKSSENSQLVLLSESSEYVCDEKSFGHSFKFSFY